MNEHVRIHTTTRKLPTPRGKLVIATPILATSYVEIEGVVDPVYAVGFDPANATPFGRMTYITDQMKKKP